MNLSRLISIIRKLKIKTFRIKIDIRNKTIQTEITEKKQEIRKGKWPT